MVKMVELLFWNKFIQKTGVKFFYIIFHNRYKFKFSDPISHKNLAKQLGVSLAITEKAVGYYVERGYLVRERTLSNHRKYVYIYRCTDKVKNELSETTYEDDRYEHYIEYIMDTSLCTQKEATKSNVFNYQNRLLLAVLFSNADTNGVVQGFDVETLSKFASVTKNSFRKQIKKLLELGYIRQCVKGFSSKVYGKVTSQYILNLDHPHFKEQLFKPPELFCGYYIYSPKFVISHNRCTESELIEMYFYNAGAINRMLLNALKKFSLVPSQELDCLAYEGGKLKDIRQVSLYLENQIPHLAILSRSELYKVAPLGLTNQISSILIMVQEALERKIPSLYYSNSTPIFMANRFAELLPETISAFSPVTSIKANVEEKYYLQSRLKNYASVILTEIWLDDAEPLGDLKCASKLHKSILLDLLPRNKIDKYPSKIINNMILFYFNVVVSMAQKYKNLLLEMFHISNVQLPNVEDGISIAILPTPRNPGIGDEVVFQLSPSDISCAASINYIGKHLFHGELNTYISPQVNLEASQYGDLMEQGDFSLTMEGYYEFGLLTNPLKNYITRVM